MNADFNKFQEQSNVTKFDAGTEGISRLPHEFIKKPPSKFTEQDETKMNDGDDDTSLNMQFSVRKINDKLITSEDNSLNLIIQSFTAPSYKIYDIKDFETVTVGSIKDMVCL